MPYWIRKTIYGTFVCLFCESLAVQIGQKWICTNVHCRQHDDIPVEQSWGSGGQGNSVQTVSTASGTMPYIAIPGTTTTS